ncbi:MAG: arylsulfatase [Verrucomicrobiae bacterium]|nr:arylsulfatase [Verrucomicrobiae bacterium]
MAVLMLFLLVGATATGAPIPGAPPPNVVVILADDLGWSDLGCYGGEIATPHLDGLARHGLRFTQFYNSGRCWPTRAALLTGYYPQQIRRDAVPGIPGGGQGRRPDWAPLLPQLLRPLGYRSYHSGKWHIDGPRLQGGFDRSYSVEDHDRFFHPRHHFADDQRLPPIEPDTGFLVTTAIADHAVRHLQEHAREHPDRPFFQYLCFTSPHFPLHAPAEDIAPYIHRYQVGWDVIREERWRRGRSLGLGRHPLSSLEPNVGPPYHFPDALIQLGAGEVNRPVPWIDLDAVQRSFQATKMAIHAAMIDRMDREIGRVLDQLRTMGAWNNTLILFLSDNGASAEIMVRGDGHDPAAAPGSAASYLCLGPGWSSAANTPFRRHKIWAHEGGIATPLIVHWPDGIRARNRFRRSPGHVIDIPPTLMELAGGTWPSERAAEAGLLPPGQSLVPAFRRDVILARDPLWWLHEGHRALRVGDWKIVAARDEPWELYDLRADRSETRNLATRHPDRVEAMAAEWQRLADRHFAAARESSGSDL